MEEKDLPITYTWRNEETIRNSAQTSHIISYNEHEANFKFNNAVKLIFEVNDLPAGFVSCTRDPDLAIGEWAFHLGEGFRGKGYSEIMLKMALVELKRLGYEGIIAIVRTNNLPSLHLHRKLKCIELPAPNPDFKEFTIVL